LWGQEREQLQRFQAELFIPISNKGTLVGLLILGPRRSAQPYNKDDLQFFSTLANQTAVAIENARLYDDLEDTFVQTVIALANAIDVRDTYTSTHSQWIAKWAVETAEYLGCTPEDIQTIRWGGLLHDIGKIGIPDHILNKYGKLNQSEWKIIHRHPVLGAEMISPIKKLAKVAPLIKYSHEHFDGSGYPYGLAGERIPLGARIISVVDSFSAMRDIRTYKKSYSVEEAVEELKQKSGSMYDPVVVESFLHVFETKGDR
jgi:putative nucleotidyltransferase with HDIG domain